MQEEREEEGRGRRRNRVDRLKNAEPPRLKKTCVFLVFFFLSCWADDWELKIYH
jgi:hypothetical protein